MTLVELFHQDGGRGLLDGDYPYVLRVSHGFDDAGNWVPHSAQGFDTLPELRDALFSLIRQGDFFTLRAGEEFTAMAIALGLQPSVREWGPGAYHRQKIVPLLEPPPDGKRIWDADGPEGPATEAA